MSPISITLATMVTPEVQKQDLNRALIATFLIKHYTVTDIANFQSPLGVSHII